MKLYLKCLSEALFLVISLLLAFGLGVLMCLTELHFDTNPKPQPLAHHAIVKRKTPEGTVCWQEHTLRRVKC